MGAAFLCAVEITKERFTPLLTLSDDRASSVINDNFRRAMNVIIEEKRFNAPVVVNTTSTVFALTVAQPDTNYGVSFQTSWPSSFTAIMNKTANSFTMQHSPPPGGGTVDWTLVR